MSPSERVHRAWQRAVQAARSTVGVPDYDAYLRHVACHHPERHVACHHPERTPMSYPEFFADRQAAR